VTHWLSTCIICLGKKIRDEKQSIEREGSNKEKLIVGVLSCDGGKVGLLRNNVRSHGEG